MTNCIDKNEIFLCMVDFYLLEISEFYSFISEKNQCCLFNHINIKRKIHTVTYSLKYIYFLFIVFYSVSYE